MGTPEEERATGAVTACAGQSQAQLSSPVELEEPGELALLEQRISTGNTLVEFSSSWCLTARLLAPLLLEAGVEVLRIDVDAHPGLADRFNVQLIPCYIRLVNGEERKRIVGAVSPSDLASL